MLNQWLSILMFDHNTSYIWSAFCVAAVVLGFNTLNAKRCLERAKRNIDE